MKSGLNMTGFEVTISLEEKDILRFAELYDMEGFCPDGMCIEDETLTVAEREADVWMEHGAWFKCFGPFEATVVYKWMVAVNGASVILHGYEADENDEPTGTPSSIYWVWRRPLVAMSDLQ